jgi:FkbM family methyltransferase
MNHQVPEHPHFRPDTVDRVIWTEAIELNVYKLPTWFSHGDFVLNIGAHTGSITWRCANSGARVFAVEPSRDNYKLLLHNTAPVADRVIPVNAAAWRSDLGPTVLRYEPNWVAANTGGGGVMGDQGGQGHDVLALPVDHLLCLQPRWRMIVIDCEGAEFDILCTSKELHRVKEIAGEYHERKDVRDFADIGMPFTMERLALALGQRGFKVTSEKKGEGMGLFWATRE